MVDKFSSSAILGIYVPKFHWQFKYCILHIARLYFASGLVFNMQKMSIVLNFDNSVSGSPPEIRLAGLLVLEIYTITYFKRGWCPVQSLLCSFEVIFIQPLLGNDQCECVLQDSAFQNLGLPRIIAWTLVADVGVS